MLKWPVSPQGGSPTLIYHRAPPQAGSATNPAAKWREEKEAHRKFTRMPLDVTKSGTLII